MASPWMSNLQKATLLNTLWRMVSDGEQIFFQDGAGFQQGHGRGRGARGWGGEGGVGVGGSTTGEGLFVVGFVAGALPVTIIPPQSARLLKTCMTSAG